MEDSDHKQKLFTYSLDICKNDLMTPWLQHELCGLETSSRKALCSLNFRFLPTHLAVNSIFVGSGITLNKAGGPVGTTVLDTNIEQNISDHVNSKHDADSV